MSNLEFWYHGPSWLRHGILSWHTQNLTWNSTGRAAGLLDLRQTSRWSWKKNVLPSSPWNSFLPVCWRSRPWSSPVDCGDEGRDCDKKAGLYIMNTPQRQDFAEEIIFLLDPLDWIPPGCLVHVLDLFLDREGLVHSGGWNNRSSHFGFYWKKYLITKLIVMDCHSRCSNLEVGSTLTELRRSSY